MKKLLLILTVFLCTAGFSQTEKYAGSSQTPVEERLGIDFEILAGNLLDSAALNNINIVLYDELRQDVMDIEVYDDLTGFTLLIYSNTRVQFNKENPENKSSWNSREKSYTCTFYRIYNQNEEFVLDFSKGLKNTSTLIADIVLNEQTNTLIIIHDNTYELEDAEDEMSREGIDYEPLYIHK